MVKVPAIFDDGGVMDTSLSHVQRCKSIKKIQELWEPEDGDFYYDENLKKVLVYHSELAIDNIKSNTWLPRQDQLQDECKKFYGGCLDSWRKMFLDFDAFSQIAKNTEIYGSYDSLERYWLGFFDMLSNL